MVVSVIIVSYNVRYLLEQCLRAVSGAVQGLDAEIFIVDNQSSDGSADYLEPLFPSFHFIRNQQNIGFAKANNQALSEAVGQYILFLNPDTIIPEDGLKKCILFMETHPQAGATGVKMIDGHGRFLKESKRGFPSPQVSLWKMTGLSAAAPRSKRFAKYYLGHLSENETHEVDVLSGAFMFVRKETLDKTGGFDERFFMYAEDIDLSYRISRAGYKNYYYPAIIILHYKGESTIRDAAYIKQFYKAMDQFVEKYFRSGAPAFGGMILQAGIHARALLEQVRTRLQKTGSSMSQTERIQVWGDEGNAARQIAILSGDPSKQLMPSTEDADKIILCEGPGSPPSQLISYMQEHPGPAYLIHMKDSAP
ncbi:MAG: glycosyltransferase family 2 protein [Flavitalea sp.]